MDNTNQDLEVLKSQNPLTLPAGRQAQTSQKGRALNPDILCRDSKGANCSDGH
jgi:hypothetical protein